MWVGLETGENMERDSEKMAGVGSWGVWQAVLGISAGKSYDQFLL
jgi:hypothetical protein